ncbi:MAG TPA: hypothetical protein G4O05_04960 [Caldilineae bacterium]|nr:hypothetical protein [Caldilineae bacterium]
MGLLLGGGALLLAAQRHVSPRWRHALPLALTLAAMASWLLMRWQPAGAGQWWLWQAPLDLEAAWGLQWDGWSWLAGWLAFMAALAALASCDGIARPGFTPPAFWIPLLLAASLMVITSATWTTLLAGWALLLFLIGILAGAPIEAAPRAWTFLLLAGLFLLLAPLFNGLGALDVVLGGAALNLQAQLLFSLGVVILMGAYPFHVWLVADPPRGRSVQLALHLLPALAAFHLLSRFQLPLLGSFSWIALGIAGLLGSAIVAWAEEDEDRAWVYVAVNRTTWALLALALSREQGAYRSIFPLVSLGVGLMVWRLLPLIRKRWSPYLALFFLMGFPFTPGFPLTRNLAQLATSVLGFPGWLLILLAQTLFVAAVLRPRVREAAQGDAHATPLTQGVVGAFMLVMAFGVWWGVSPAALLRTAGLAPEGMVMNVFAPIRFSGLLTGWLTLLLPLLLGWLLARWQDRLFAGQERLRAELAAIADLSWLVGLSRAGLHYVALALGFGADILDGAGQFGWVLLVLLILWLFFR